MRAFFFFKMNFKKFLYDFFSPRYFSFCEMRENCKRLQIYKCIHARTRTHARIHARSHIYIYNIYINYTYIVCMSLQITI